MRDEERDEEPVTLTQGPHGDREVVEPPRPKILRMGQLQHQLRVEMAKRGLTDSSFVPVGGIQIRSRRENS